MREEFLESKMEKMFYSRLISTKWGVQSVGPRLFLQQMYAKLCRFALFVELDEDI